MDKKQVEYILKSTRENYNRIAQTFSRTREYLPNDLLELKKYIKEGEKVLDLGCGNGRFSELFKDMDYEGCDNSIELIKIAKTRYKDKKFFNCDIFDLDFKNKYEKIFCLAVFHHIPTEKLRLIALKNIHNALKPGGYLVLTSWNLEDKNRKKPDHFEKGDFLYPFKDSENEGTVVERFVHKYELKEIIELLQKNNFQIISSRIVYRGKNQANSNLEVVARKL